MRIKGVPGLSLSLRADPTALTLTWPGRPPSGQSVALGRIEAYSTCPCWFIKKKRKTVSRGSKKQSDSVREKQRVKEKQYDSPETERDNIGEMENCP